MQGCKFYYKVQTEPRIAQTDISRFESLDKYMILHRGDNAWHMKDVAVAAGFLSGTLADLPADHLLYLKTNPEKGNRYKKIGKYDETCVLQEVHLYVGEASMPALKNGDRVKVAVDSIRKAEIYQMDKCKTNMSWLIPGIGVPVLLGAGIVGIVVGSESGMNLSLGSK